jgi:phage repressor protein C with HTH and peptisase S24 domain
MDAMHAAIKAKRSGKLSGLLGGEEPAQPTEAESGMAELVAKLSPEQKHELFELLKAEAPTAEGAEQGEEADKEYDPQNPSQEEKGAIDEEMSAGEGDDSESDNIAMSMIDSKAKNASDDMKPRNLGERVRFEMAKKLKAKNKI